MIGKDTMHKEELPMQLATAWPKIVLKQTAIPTPKHVYINLLEGRTILIVQFHSIEQKERSTRLKQCSSFSEWALCYQENELDETSLSISNLLTYLFAIKFSSGTSTHASGIRKNEDCFPEIRKERIELALRH